MAAATYQSALELAETLTPAEKLKLISALEARVEENASPKRVSIMELCGLGAEIWKGIDAQEYVDNERASWEK